MSKNFAVETAFVAARFGLRNMAEDIIRTAFSTKKAQEKHIAELPAEDAELKSIVLVFDTNGISVMTDWPKGEHVRPISTPKARDIKGEYEAAKAANMLRGGAKVDVDKMTVTFPDRKGTKVLSWRLLDGKKNIIKREYVDGLGLRRTEVVENKAVAERIRWAVRFASGEKWGVRVWKNNARYIHMVDAFFAPDSLQRYWGGAVARRDYKAAVREANGDGEAAKAMMAAYKVVSASGNEKIRSLTPDGVEKLRKLGFTVEPVPAQ